MDRKNGVTDCEREFYQDSLPLLTGTIAEFLSCIEAIRAYRKETEGRDPVCACSARIKSAASMREKLLKRGLPPDREHALSAVSDAAGVRLICPLTEDVYRTAALIREIPGVSVAREKDYIAHPKPNGYRSYHMVLHFPLRFLGAAGADNRLWLEVQLRTIAMDCWASIEHELKYKKQIANPELMRRELKRCSDEIASADLSLSTLKELIEEKENCFETSDCRR